HQLVSAGAVRSLRPAGGHEPRPPLRRAPDRRMDAGARAAHRRRRAACLRDARMVETTVPAADAPAAAARNPLARLGPFLGLLGVILVFALLTDTPDQYLSIRNFRIVVAQTVIVALGAIGMTMIIVSGGIDLSVGSVIALTGVVTAIALRDGLDPLTSVLLGVAAGGVVGVVNGLLVTRLRVIPFIATLGTLG